MFKRSVSIFLCFVMILSLAGCGQANNATTPSEPAVTEAPTQAATEEVTEAPTEETAPQVIETDENLLTVDITFPASFFEGTDMSTFDTDAYVKEQKFISAKLNDDGSMVVTMSKSRHNELLDEMAAELETTFSSLVEAAETPYIKEISHNEDFSLVTVKVDRAAYENAFDMTPFIVGISASMYQMLLDMEYHVEVVMVDVATGETISSVVYPDDLG